MSAPPALPEIARLFLRLGATAFGGPAAHIAMMEREVVGRLAWVDRQEFLDLVSASNLIPGPNSTELAIHLGYRRGGWPGLVVAGLCFILPAMLLTMACGWAYVRWGALPAATALLYGVKPVILAIVVQAVWGLAPKAAPTTPLRLLGLGSLAAVSLGVDELLVLLAAGLAALLLRRPWAAFAATPLFGLPGAVGGGGGAAVGAAAGLTISGIFMVFLRIGSVLYGSGYVLLAFLRSELVEARGWLTEAQLLDAVAVGQVTPGPVFTTATFVGWILAGPAGALAATAGIFLPAFVFVALSGPLVPRLRASPAAGAFLDGVNVASLALLVAVSAALARAAVVDLPTLLVAVVAGGLLIRGKVDPTWLILGFGVLGWGLRSLG